MTRNSIVTVTRIVLILSFAACGSSTQCYRCQGAAPAGAPCRDEQWNDTSSTIIKCPAKCAIYRQDILEPKYFYFIRRDCHDNETEDGCTVNGNMRTCRTSCSGDFCNGGSGIPEGADTTTKPGTTTTKPATTTTKPATTTTSTKATLPPGAFMCWSCTMSGAGSDITCFTNPDQVATANRVVCVPPRQCYVKVYYSDRLKRITSFDRGCLPVVEPRNRCVQDSYGTTCQTFCEGHYCNEGKGVPAGTKPPWDKGPVGSAGPCTPSLFFINVVFLLWTIEY